MQLSDKTTEELELENKILRELLLKESTKQQPSPQITRPKARKILYQCRYCGYKSIRNATDGVPLTTANCPKHPRGWCKGVHSWMRTYL